MTDALLAVLNCDPQRGAVSDVDMESPTWTTCRSAVARGVSRGRGGPRVEDEAALRHYGGLDDALSRHRDLGCEEAHLAPRTVEAELTASAGRYAEAVGKVRLKLHGRARTRSWLA